MQLGSDKRRQIAPPQLVVNNPELGVITVCEVLFVRFEPDVVGLADGVTVVAPPNNPARSRIKVTLSGGLSSAALSGANHLLSWNAEDQIGLQVNVSCKPIGLSSEKREAIPVTR